MNFEFSEEQAMLRDGLARLLEQKYPFETRQRLVAGTGGDGIWDALVDMGLVALALPESAGGLGGSPSDIVAVSELLGRYLVVEPFLSSALLTGRLLASFPSSPGTTEHLAALASGSGRGAFAHEEANGTAAPDALATRISSVGGRTVLNGRKRLVLDAADADVFLVTARDDAGATAVAAVSGGAAGVAIRSYRTIDGRMAADVDFTDVEVDLSMVKLLADGELQAMLSDALLAVSAEAVGAMHSLMQMTGDFAATRKQFGAPIGSFQAIAHRLADMKIAYIKARASLLYTAALADSGRAATQDFSVLKAQIGRQGRIVGESAVQIHGGIGTTDELPVGHYLKRILSVDAMFGSSEYHLREIGRTQRAA